MNKIDLLRVDLNLLPVFEVLVEERHVSRAAERLGRTQSAVSHALERLRELVLAATHVPKPRKATRPTRGSQQRRLSEKTHRGQIKSLRGKPDDH
jgi:protein subunit release factor B